MIVPFYGGQLVANPVEVVKWAVSVGRIAAVDAATWLGYLTGPGAQDYCDQLFAPGGGSNVELPSGVVRMP